MVNVHNAQKVDQSRCTDEKKTIHCNSRAFSSKTPTKNGTFQSFLEKSYEVET